MYVEGSQERGEGQSESGREGSCEEGAQEEEVGVEKEEEEEEIKSQELPEATAGGGVCEGRRGRKREIIGEHLPAADRQ